MRYLVCSVFDAKVGAYMAPFNMRSRGEAIRSFESACRDEKMPFGAYPADYRLFLLGEYDDETGVFINSSPGPQPLIGAGDFVIAEKSAAS